MRSLRPPNANDGGVVGCTRGACAPQHNVEHVQGPVAFFDFDFPERLHVLEAFADFACWRDAVFGDDGDASFSGDPVQGKVATNTAKSG